MKTHLKEHIVRSIRIFTSAMTGKFHSLLALGMFLPLTVAAQTVTISGPSRVVGTTNVAKKLGKEESYAWFELAGTLNAGSTVTAAATNGVLTLDGTAGLAFSAGDGTGDASMSFSGSLADVNAALDGLVLMPNAGFSGEMTVTVSISGTQTASRSAPVTVSLPLNLASAQTAILNGVTTLHTNLTKDGERLLVYGPNAGGLFHVGSNRLITSGVATWGSGRMVGLPNENAANLDWSLIADIGNTAVFLENAVRWASQTTGTNAVIVSGNAATATWLQGRGFTAAYAANWWDNLAGKNLVILYSRDVDHPVNEANRITALNNFVRAGGGVIVMGDAWSHWNRPKLNQAFFPAGLGWQHGEAEDDYVVANRCASNTSVANIDDYRSSYTTSQTDQAVANLTEFNRDHIAIDSTLGEEYYWMSVRSLLQYAPAIPSPTPEAPLTADRKMDIAMLNIEAIYMHGLAASNLNFPFRWTFPVAAGAPRVNVVRTFNLPLTSKSRWVQTGLYLAPGEVGTVTAPAGMVNAGIQVYVGHQTAESSGDLVLPPQVIYSYDLTSTQTTIANPHGGVVMLKIPSKRSFSGAQVTFSGVVEMPTFKLGETTDAAWVGGIRDRGTPFAVIESPAISIIVRADTNSPVRGYNDLEAGMTHLNEIMTHIYDFYSWNPIDRYDAWEIAYANGGAAIWPYQLDWNESSFSLRAICAGETGLNLHELGHSVDPVAIKFKNFFETTPNLSAHYLANLGYVERWKRHNADVNSHVDAYLRTQGNVDLWNKDDHHDVEAKEVHVRGYGDQFGMATVMDIIADMIAVNPSTEADRLDEWLYQFSTHAGFDVSPWFACWRLYPTAAGASRVNSLPKWNLIGRGPEDMIVEQNTSVTFLDPSLNDYSYDGVLNLVSVGNPLHGTVVNNGNGTYTYTPTTGYTGNDKIVYTVSNGLGNQFPTDIPITVLPSSNYPALVSGQVGVGSSSWTTVHLDRSYSNMVVVAQPVLVAGMPPVVTRIQNASGDSFSVKVQRADGQSGSLDGVLVQYMVVEAGVYTVAQHGIKMEAGTFTSSVTDRKGSFIGQKVPMGNDLYSGYVWPVIYGQVMTTNDPQWSVFWAGEWANQMTMGKHVGEDPAQTRADESIGYMVFESEDVTAQIGNLRFRPIYSRYSDMDYLRTSTSSFQYDRLMPPLTGVMAAADCNFNRNGTVAQTFDGFWPVLEGPGLLQNNLVSARLVEDQMADSEMSDPGKFNGGYMLFSSTVNTPPYLQATLTNQIMAMNGQVRVVSLSGYFGDMTPNGLTYSVAANSNPALVQPSVTGTDLTLNLQANQTGVAYITVVARDGSGAWVQETIAVWVMANTAPGTVPDSANTPTNTAVLVNVVANDTDAESPNSLTVSNVTNPAHGIVVNHGNGTVTYTPDNGWSGNDSFNYTVQDELGLSAVGTVSVRVGDIGGNMVIYYNFEETAGNVIFDRSGASVRTDASVIGQTMDLASTPGILGKAYHSKLGNYAAIDPSPNGVLEGAIADAMKFGDNATGTDFTIAGWFKFMDTAPNEFGNFDWGSGNTREQSAGFAIRRDFSRYYAVGGSNYGLGFDYPDIPVNTWRHIAFSGDRQGSLTMYINGVKVGTATGWGAETGNSYENHMPFLFGAHLQGVVDDGNTVNDDFAVWHRALSATEVQSIYNAGVAATPQSIADLAGIVPAAPAAPVAMDDNRITGEGVPLAIAVLENDIDPNTGDLLSLQSVTQGVHGQVAANSDGTVSYTPDAGFTGVDSFTYLVRDPGGLTDVGTVSVLVTQEVGTITYTLNYTAGPNGSLSGTTPQTVDYGAGGTAITAAPDTGYHFVNWSDGSTNNPRTDADVTSHITVTANFAINTYTLTYTAGPNGTLTGTTPQTVDYGASGNAITATPDTGYHFVNWSDGSTNNPRTDADVTSNITVTANFAINTYTLTYTAGPNGTLTGITPQTVEHGASSSAVMALPDPGASFASWSDGSRANPRTEANVTADLSLTAHFISDAIGLIWDANPTATGAQDGSGNWGDSDAKWWNGSANLAWIDHNPAVFGAGITTNQTVSITSDVTPSAMVFNATGGGSYTIAAAGGGIHLEGTPEIAADGNAAISAPLVGNGGFNKSGSGTLTLAGINTYTSTTTVNGGTLLINGSLANTPTTVNAAGTLGGTGTIAGTVTNHGTLTPGHNTVGNLTVNNALTLAGGSNITWGIANWTGAAGIGHDKLTVTSLNLTATAGDPVTIHLNGSALANFTEASRTFTLLETTSAITGFDPAKFVIDASALTTPQGTWAVQQSGNNLLLTYTRSNTAPVFTVNPINTNGTQGVAVTGSITATDPDSAETLTYAVISGPTWLSVGTDGSLSGMPGNANVGLNEFVVEVTDSFNVSVTATLNITVANVNDAPVFTANPINLEATEDSALIGQLAATDVDAGDTLTYSKVSGPDWLVIAPFGALSGTPSGGDAGPNGFIVRVTDAGGASTDATLNITVLIGDSNGTWTNLAGGSWPTSGNWSDGMVASGQGKTADFSSLNLTEDTTVTLNGARMIGNLSFADTTASHNWIVNPGSAGSLSLDVATGTPTIAVNNQTATLNVVLAGTKGLAKTGAGNLTLGAANSYSGGTTITTGANGVLLVGHASALGTDPVLVNGQTQFGLTLQVNSNLAITNALTLKRGQGGSGRATMSLGAGADWRGAITLDNSGSNGFPTIYFSGTNAATSSIVSGNITASGLGGNAQGASTLALRTGSGGWGKVTGTVNLGGGYLDFISNPTIQFSGSGNSWGKLGVNGATSKVYVGAVNTLSSTGVVLATTANNLGSGLFLNDMTGTTAYDQTVAGLGNGVRIGMSGSLAATLTLNTIADQSSNAIISGAISLVKSGSAKQTLTGVNTYTGNTTVSAGTLSLADNAELRFVIGAASGVCNSLSGAGSATIDGDFNIDTTLADAGTLNSGSWIVENLATVYGETFRVISGATAWAATGNVWIKSSGTKNYSFDESTGILTMTNSAGLGPWITSNGLTGPDFWIASKGLTGSDAAFDADPDNDGLDNGLEFVLGGEPNPAKPEANSASLLPTMSQSGGIMAFTFKRKDISESGVAVTFQWSTDLTFPSPANDVPVGAVSSTTDTISVDVTEDAPDADTDTIVITVPKALAAGGRVFGRLRAVKKP